MSAITCKWKSVKHFVGHSPPMGLTGRGYVKKDHPKIKILFKPGS